MVLLKKPRRKKESRLVNEWLWEFHRTSLQWRRVRLGPVHTHERARMFMVLLRWADAVFIEDGIVHIVEAKLRPKADAIGQLEYYKELFRTTPEFDAYKTWPIQLIFLTTMLDAGLVEFAEKKDIKYIIYAPEWVNEF